MTSTSAPVHEQPASGEDEVFAFPASFAQQRLWFLDQLDPGAPVYSIPQALRLAGPLDAGALHGALRELVRRHEALRTTFAARDGAPLQLVAPSLELPLPVTDLAALAAAERDAEVRRLCDEEARRPFDLAQGPLLRAALLRLGPEDHVLLVTVHHIVCDGWSLAVLFRELGALYRRARGDASAPPPEPAVQQADHAIWEREQLGGEALQRQLAYWRERLAGELPVLELPADHRPPERTSRGACLRFELSPALTDSLVAIGRREGASLYMTLLSAFQLWLGRLSGQRDVLVGSPIANRDRPELESAVGFFTSTVVLRGDLSGDPPFRELLRRVKESALGAFAHQEVPLERIVEAVRPDRAGGQNPLFQAMFASQRAPESAFDLPGVRATPLPVHSGTAKFDILVEMQELERGMQCFFEYSADLFEEPTARRLLGHLETLLRAIAEGPDRRLSELPLLEEAERRRILEEWNATAAETPAACAHELIAAQARRTPDGVAVELGGERLRYDELARRAGVLARHLRGLGVGPDVLVGVCLPRTFDLPVALLGVLQAGGAYLPLDGAHPPERLAYTLGDARAPVLITDSTLAADLPQGAERRVLLDRDWPAMEAAGPAEAPAVAVSPEHLAYTIYTSGSTGRPKGVQVPHGALTNFLCSMGREPGLGPADRLLAVTTVSFDIAGLELLLPLCVGATVILADREEAADGETLRLLIEERRPTVMQATPATWRLLIEAGWRGVLHKGLCGGEALPPALAAQLLERLPELWNMYGPTETTIWSTCCRVTDAARISIGRPIANTRLYILDDAQGPAPVGVAGELYIGGAGVARGYLGRPDLSAERFVPEPFAEGGARAYRTGDLCRYREDGSVEYLRRNDHQVKVRGFRIELGEIEAVLEQDPAVQQAVVVVREDTPGDQRIVAYVVHRPGAAPTASELRGALRERLPDYMVPHLVVELDRLPLGPSGKVDRRALPDPLAAPGEDDHHVAPRTPMEALIAGIFRELLRAPRVGLLDNFYDLGGHSLLSVQLVHRIERDTGHRLSPRALVYQNVEQLAAECDRAVKRPEAERPGRPRSLLGSLKGRIFGSED